MRGDGDVRTVTVNFLVRRLFHRDACMHCAREIERARLYIRDAYDLPDRPKKKHHTHTHTENMYTHL